MLNDLMLQMAKFFRGDAHNIQHFTKVHAFSRYIGMREGLAPDALFTLEAAAYTHDIGIKPAREKYGSSAGYLQEIEGPAAVKPMMDRLGFDASVTERVMWLIAHHHTYDNVTDIDHRILIEADFLVNLFEGNASPDAVRSAYGKYFVTAAGREMCREMFDIEE